MPTAATVTMPLELPGLEACWCAAAVRAAASWTTDGVVVEVGRDGAEVVVELAVAESGTGVAAVVVDTAGNVVEGVSVELGHSAVGLEGPVGTWSLGLPLPSRSNRQPSEVPGDAVRSAGPSEA